MLQYLKPSLFLDTKSTRPSPLADCSTSAYPSAGTNRLAQSTVVTQRGRRLLAPLARLLRSSADLVNSTVLHIRDGLTEEQRRAQRRWDERKQILRLRLDNAQTLEAWRAAACELDVLEENDAWKADPQSDEYDVQLITARLAQLDDARISCDIPKMLYLIRTALSRDLGEMGSIRLYKHSRIGTKDLIERYIDSVLDTIRALASLSDKALPDGLEIKDVLEQVVYARQAFGRSALLLSGGGTFGMNHIGVLKALFEAHLLPRIISGASAGSIVCAVLCTRKDEEIPHVLAAFPYGDLAVFEEEGHEDGVLQRVGRLLTQGSWIDSKHLIRVMRQMLGDMTFQEAYNRTRRILNISVSSESIYELPRLLNYVTSPNVMIWSAVAASCSVPLLFSGTSLLVKNPVTGEHSPWNPTPQRWIDGSVDNDLPLTRLAEMFNVNSTITSQVNPHVVPFLAKGEAEIAQAAQSSATTTSDWTFTLASLAKNEALHRMSILADLGFVPNLITKARSILSQNYSGDITILPEINYRDFHKILKNPTSEFMEAACLRGERATWPKLSRVRNHCAIELELDSAVQALRARVVFSPSQVDLRRMSSVTIRGDIERGSIGVERKRRVSGSNVHALTFPHGEDGKDEEGPSYPVVMSGDRLPVRTASSQWSPPTRRCLPPLSSPHLTLSKINSAPSSALPLSNDGWPSSAPAPKSKSRRSPFYISPPSPNAASETERTDDLAGFASSDADIDSRTEDSSPEAETSSSADDGHLSRRHTIPHLPRHAMRSESDGSPLFASITPSPSLQRQQPASRSSQACSPVASHSSLALTATMPPSSMLGGAGS
ncbi:MAG: hypothetical protein M1818_007446 [Claussenomyces sp. TS43310]|nr:MAG: hypothetical protein M1818_007446 [Claussenomyces sp. TS43310]